MLISYLAEYVRLAAQEVVDEIRSRGAPDEVEASRSAT